MRGRGRRERERIWISSQAMDHNIQVRAGESFGGIIYIGVLLL